MVTGPYQPLLQQETVLGQMLCTVGFYAYGLGTMQAPHSAIG